MTTAIAVCGLVLAASAAPKVAVIHSAWSDRVFDGEWDDELQALGWASEEFENVQVGQLAPRLGEFDLVIAGSVANYENPVDMTPYRDAWLNFLQAGGCLLVTDANYGTTLNDWVNTFGPGFALSTATCASHRDGTPESRVTTWADHPLLTCPNDLGPVLSRRWTIWAHMDSWPEGWESLITCQDGKSLFLARPVGEGLLVVTSHFSFRSPQDQGAGVALLENVWLNALNGRSGLRVTRLEFGPSAPGPAAAILALRNDTGAPLAVRARVAVEPAAAEGASEGASVELATGEATEVRVPYAIVERGKVTARLVVENRSGTLLEWPKALDIPEAVTLTLQRKHLYPNRPMLEAAATLAPPTDAGPGDAAVVWYIDGDYHSRAEGVEGAASLAVDIDKLRLGKHTLGATLFSDDQAVGEASAEFFHHGDPRFGVRGDGVTLLEGKPFFPFGFYHVSQSFDAAHRSQCVRDLAAAGFNCAHTRAMTVEEYGPFLDECAKLGVYIVTEFSAPMFETVERYRDHPAVLAWNPGDEPELNGLSAEEFASRYDRLKQIDPNHLIYAVIANPQEYVNYALGTEVLAPDPYPIPNAPVSVVYHQLKQARLEAERVNTMLWGVLQCFGTYGPWTRPPSAQELRAMTYLALLAGVKGIIYYTYGDQGWVVTEHPEQWEAAKALVPEMQRLSPAILDGEFTLLCEGEGGVFAGAWAHEGKTHTVVVNTSDEPRAFDPVGPVEPMGVAVKEG